MEVKIWIYGAGAVGCYYGARLNQAGNQILFIARGKQLETLQKNGLKIKSYKGDLEILPSEILVSSVDNLDKQFEPDLIIVATKSTANQQVIQKLKNLNKLNTPIFIFQNGVKSHYPYLIDFKNVSRVIINIAAALSEPGVLIHKSGEMIFIQSKTYSQHESISNNEIPFAKELIHSFESVNIPTKLSENIEIDIWSKMIWNAAFNSVTALTGLTTSPILNDADGIKLIRNIGKEVFQLAKLNNINIPENVIEDKIIFTRDILGDISTSTLEDVRKDNALEYQAIIGDLIEEANRFNIELPYLRTTATLLKLLNKKIIAVTSK
jgi:2-dehydropantoate 2-reductase